MGTIEADLKPQTCVEELLVVMDYQISRQCAPVVRWPVTKAALACGSVNQQSGIFHIPGRFESARPVQDRKETL
jgi:hypothetical protein